MTTRRGFLGLLAGTASAATFMTRFPLLPRAEALSSAPSVHGNFEVGLLREGTHELRARGYCRTKPHTVAVLDYGRTVEVRAWFPTVTQGCWKTRGMGLYEPNGGKLLFYQHWDCGPILLVPGNSLEAIGNFKASVGLSTRALHMILGITG